MKQIDRIRKFSDAFGPSGFEDAVVAYAQEEVREICTCKEDHMRNLYMNLKGSSQGGVNIMLDAHSDEVGFIVQAVKSNGLLRFLPLGGWDVKNIIANKVHRSFLMLPVPMTKSIKRLWERHLIIVSDVPPLWKHSVDCMDVHSRIPSVQPCPPRRRLANAV